MKRSSHARAPAESSALLSSSQMQSCKTLVDSAGDVLHKGVQRRKAPVMRRSDGGRLDVEQVDVRVPAEIDEGEYGQIFKRGKAGGEARVVVYQLVCLKHTEGGRHKLYHNQGPKVPDRFEDSKAELCTRQIRRSGLRSLKACIPLHTTGESRSEQVAVASTGPVAHVKRTTLRWPSVPGPPRFGADCFVLGFHRQLPPFLLL